MATLLASEIGPWSTSGVVSTMRMHRSVASLALAAAALLVPSVAVAQTEAEMRALLEQIESTDQRHEPFQVFDNLYYVGLEWVSAWLLETSDGLVLIDALYGEHVEHLLDSVRRLGFDPAQIHTVLVTHAHFDHLGGAPAIRALSGARIGMTAADWAMNDENAKLGNGGAVALEHDLVLDDGEALDFGDTRIECFVTPGHTPGVLSLRFPVRDGVHTYTAFVFGGVGLNFSGVERTEAYLASVRRLQALGRIDVNVPNHPGMGRVFERAEALAAREPGEAHPFVDPEGFQTWTEQLLENGRRKLEGEQRAVAAGTPPR